CRRAVAALQRVAFAERGLKIGDFTAVGEPLDRFHRRTVCLNRKDQTRANDVTVQANRAGATNAMLASDMRSRQMLLLPQKVCKIETRRYLRLDVLAVNSEGDCAGRDHVSVSSAWPAIAGDASFSGLRVRHPSGGNLHGRIFSGD